MRRSRNRTALIADRDRWSKEAVTPRSPGDCVREYAELTWTPCAPGVRRAHLSGGPERTTTKG
eukprot:14361470-Alexandrium_andersonii.AAC.1